MRRLINNSFFVILIALYISSCTTVSNISVSNVNNSETEQPPSFIYSIPQTVIDVSVIAEEISIIPGPYEKYAEKYLGIQHAPVKPEKIYNIKKVLIGKHLEADPDYIYTATGVQNTNKFPNLEDLIKDSLILKPKNFSANIIKLYSFPSQSNEPMYTDLSIKRNFEAEKDIEVSMVMPDTNYVSRPTKSVLKEKTLEQKAEEAANFLIKLKKRRFKMVAGQNDYMPEGESMSDALKELTRIENEYLSLFIGKREVNIIERSFHYTPEQGKTTERIVIFRFGENQGFIDSRETGGLPVLMQIDALNKTNELGKNPLKMMTNTIPYRIADQANIKILAGEDIWAEAIFPIFQYGAQVLMKIE